MTTSEGETPQMREGQDEGTGNEHASEPAHIQAAAQAAGEATPSAGALAVGVGMATAAEALHGANAAGAASGHANEGFVRAFDTNHPPDPELIADCVHCGFCLPTCPTYLLWGEEMDSPRGRILLMKAASEGDIGLTETTTRHWDQCLGCMACVTACPSGVQYDKLIEATRAQVERRYARAPSDRVFRSMLFALFPHTGRLRATVPLLWVYQKTGAKRLSRTRLAKRLLPERLRGMQAMLPPVRLSAMTARLPELTPARPEKRRRVGLLAGCVQRVFFDDVNAATVRVLAAEGCDVVVPRGQGCCGALCYHSGREDEALIYARRLIDAFEAANVDTIVVNAAGCGSTMKEYGYLLRDDPTYAERARTFAAKVRDVTELLAELEPAARRFPIGRTVAMRHSDAAQLASGAADRASGAADLADGTPVPLRVAYHDACHLSHAQGIRRQPREVLRAIPGVELVDIPEGEICCGSAGIYNLVEPGPAAELGERKARNILSTRPDVIVAGNPGCLLQISASLERLGERIPTLHPVELVDASIRGEMKPTH